MVCTLQRRHTDHYGRRRCLSSARQWWRQQRRGRWAPPGPERQPGPRPRAGRAAVAGSRDAGVAPCFSEPAGEWDSTCQLVELAWLIHLTCRLQSAEPSRNRPFHLARLRKLRLIYISDPWCSGAIIRVSSKAETPSVHGIKHGSSSLDERKECSSSWVISSD